MAMVTDTCTQHDVLTIKLGKGTNMKIKQGRTATIIYWVVAINAAIIMLAIIGVF